MSEEDKMSSIILERLESHMVDFNEHRSETRVWQARIEEQMKSERNVLGTMVRLVRGDGNGNRGLLMITAELRQAVQDLVRRQDRLEGELREELKSLRKSSRGAAEGERAKWRVAADLVGKIGPVLAAVAAAIAAWAARHQAP